MQSSQENHKYCGQDSCKGGFDVSKLSNVSMESNSMVKLLTQSLQATTSFEAACMDACEPYNERELHKLNVVQSFIDSKFCINFSTNNSDDESTSTSDSTTNPFPFITAISAIRALCEARATCIVTIEKPIVKIGQTRSVLDPCCGLCSERINKHLNIQKNTVSGTNTQQNNSNNMPKSVKLSCGHQIATSCAISQYIALKFCGWRLPDESAYKAKLESQGSQGFFSCQLCNQNKLDYSDFCIAVKSHVDAEMAKRPKFECLICYTDELDREEESVELFDCTHIYCEDCLRSYIISRVNEQKFRYSDMHCPSQGCDKLIHNLTVDRLIKNQQNMPLYNRMIRLQLVNLQLGEKHIKVSQCPGFLKRNKKSQVESIVEADYITKVRLGMAPGLSDEEEFVSCPAIFTFNEKAQKEYACTVCKYTSCLKGCEDSHKGSVRGKDCKSFQKWKQLNSNLDKDILAFFDKQTMCQCPKCKAIIIRNGGCNHMTCTMPSCGFEFCFRCLKPWICWRHLHYF